MDDQYRIRQPGVVARPQQTRDKSLRDVAPARREANGGAGMGQPPSAACGCAILAGWDTLVASEHSGRIEPDGRVARQLILSTASTRKSGCGYTFDAALIPRLCTEPLAHRFHSP